MENSQVVTLRVDLPDGAKQGDIYTRKPDRNMFVNTSRENCATWDSRFVVDNPDFFSSDESCIKVLSFYTTNKLRDGDKRTYVFEVYGEIPIEKYAKVKTAIEVVVNKK